MTHIHVNGCLSLAVVVEHLLPVAQQDAHLRRREGGREGDHCSLAPDQPGFYKPLALEEAGWLARQYGNVCYLDDVEAELDDVLGTGAVVSGPSVHLEGLARGGRREK